MELEANPSNRLWNARALGACALWACLLWTGTPRCEDAAPKTDTPAVVPDAQPEGTPPAKAEEPAKPPEKPPETTAPAFKPIEMAALPDFKNDVEDKVTKCGKCHTNGLVSTVNYSEFEAGKVEDEKIKLPKDVTGFRDDLEVRVAFQDRNAPLAVVLLGFYAKSDSKLARAWASYLHKNGCHVLVFDSVFHSRFNERTGHGMPGNLREEAKVVAKIVDTVLAFRPEKETKRIREKTTTVRVLGTSYGGLLALNVLREPQAKAWPIDRMLVLSSPVRMQTAAETLDEFYHTDRPKFEISLMKLVGGFKPDHNPPTERECSLMRAGIAYDFYDSLEDILSKNEKLYMPGLFEKFKTLEEANEVKVRYEERARALEERQTKEMDALKKTYEKFKDDKQKKEEFKRLKKSLEERFKVEENDLKKKLSDTEYWTFKDFVEQMAAPYWKMQPAEIWAQGELGPLLKDAPDFVQAVLCADDPLNKPEELKALQEKIPPPKLLVLPNGGHLGYTGTKWIQEMIKKFFAP
ncbi:MAG: alpha/beta fold hydrolase [Planctomycetota bacterium]|nr:alpha/beta fold hydrolase [Planctomycetota bacterium]